MRKQHHQRFLKRAPEWIRLKRTCSTKVNKAKTAANLMLGGEDRIEQLIDLGELKDSISTVSLTLHQR